MIPTQGKGVDAVNFRILKESESVDISRTRSPNTETSGDVTDKTEDIPDPFGDFNSGNYLVMLGLTKVTLHYDGDDYHSDEALYVGDYRNTTS